MKIVGNINRIFRSQSVDNINMQINVQKLALTPKETVLSIWRFCEIYEEDVL